MRRYFSAFIVIVFASFSANAVGQQTIRVEVENLQGAGGFYFTPVLFGLHDGTVDMFDMGDSAGNNAMGTALQALAEGGDTSGLTSLFAESGLVTSPGGFAGAPVFDPGELATVDFNASTSNRFFSFASMLIPSNDVFFGNNNPSQFEIFDANGDFTGPLEFTIQGSMLYDAGTEVLDSSVAAFVPGGSGAAGAGGGPDQNGTVQFLDDGSGTGFTAFNNEFNGQTTAAGTTVTTNLSAGSQIARIRITAVPEPNSLALLGLIGIGSLVFARRRKTT